MLSSTFGALISQNHLRWLVAGLFLMCLQACAVFEPDSPELVVQQRAQALIDALLAGDREKAFSYTTPAYQSSSSPNRLAGKYAGVATWTAVEVGEVTCEFERCIAQIMISYRMIRPAIENTRPLEQVWVNVDGQWYFYPNA